MAGLSYMQRRTSGIYEFRKRLPQAIAGKPAPSRAPSQISELINSATHHFKRELTVSLGTSDYSTAKRRDLREAARVTDLFALAVEIVAGRIRSDIGEAIDVTPDEVEAHFIREVLTADESARLEGDARRHMQSPAERAKWPDLEQVSFDAIGMQPSHLIVMEEEIDFLLSGYRDALARYDFSIVKPELHSFLTERQIPIDPSAKRYIDLGLAALRGHARGYEMRKLRQQGSHVPTPEPAQTTRGPKLSEALKLWKEGSPARGGKKPSPSTVREAERAVRYFREWHGDLPVGSVTKEKARDFRNALARLPTRLTDKQRKLPLRQLLAAVKPGQEAVHAASVNKYLNLLVALVSNVEREGLMDGVAGFTNPFSKLSLTVDKRNDPNRREPFSEAALKQVFSCGIFLSGDRPLGGGGEAAYWFPLIALFSGARLNEIAQLRIADILQDPETGIWLIDIGTEGGRSIKTVSSRRQVPVHPELIRLGLLGYRERLLKGGAKLGSTLWPKVKSADDQYRSTAWSKWFNRYLRETAGIKDTSIVFHSFRHTFKRLARDAALSEELHDSLTGHTGSGGVGRSYGAGFGLRALQEAIERIAVPKSIAALPGPKKEAER